MRVGQGSRHWITLTADCLPVVITSEKRDWLGIAHAGWGLALGIIGELISYSYSSSELVTWIGPSIQKIGLAKKYGVDDIQTVLRTHLIRVRETFLNLVSVAESQLISWSRQSRAFVHTQTRDFLGRRVKKCNKKFDGGLLLSLCLRVKRLTMCLCCFWDKVYPF